MLKDTKTLWNLGNQVLFHTVEVVQRGLRTPADGEHRKDVGCCPVEDFLQLWPVLHSAKVHGFHGCTGNHETVKALALHIRPGAIKGVHVL